MRTNDYDYKYEVAKQYLAEGQSNRAAILFQEVIAMLKGTDKGEESLFLLGMSHYQAENYDAAASVFRKFYETYPKGYLVEEARFYAGKALYECTPEPKLDQSATYEAISEFQGFLDAYPDSKLRESAQQMILPCKTNWWRRNTCRPNCIMTSAAISGTAPTVAVTIKPASSRRKTP